MDREMRSSPERGSLPDVLRSPKQRLHPDVLAAQEQDVRSFLIFFRLINAICIRTFFQPDEYFQALEPAWAIAFGDQGGAWLTWEWRNQLRSSLHPTLFGAVYLVADGLMGVIDVYPPLRAWILVALPTVTQSVFSAICDFYTWKLAERIFGRDSTPAWATLWVAVFNPWLWYSSTRTFSNSLETTLTVVALYYWPWEMLGDLKENKHELFHEKGSVSSLRISLISAALAVVLRPTNILVWLAISTLGVTRLTLDGSSPLRRSSLVTLVREVVLCGVLVLAASVVSDRLYFGFWTFPPYKFLHFNISQSLAVFYGRMPWHYYLSQGIPLLTTTFLPFVLLGLFRATSASGSTSILQANIVRTFAFTVLTTVGALSVISHKEVRFIYPLLPILQILAAPFVSRFFTAAQPKGDPGVAPPQPTAETATATTTTLRHKVFLGNLVSINLLLAIYLGSFHQAGPISAVNFLRYEFERRHPDRLGLGAVAAGRASPDDDPLFALFLTPCHSTPWRSHLVYPHLRARALTCEPPLGLAPGSPERAAYLDEADRFYAGGAAAFLSAEMWPGEQVPRFVVGFEGLEDDLRDYFSLEGAHLGVNLTRSFSAFNGFFNEDWRRSGRLIVWDTGVDGGTCEWRD